MRFARESHNRSVTSRCITPVKSSAAFGYRVGKPVAMAPVNKQIASPLEGLVVDVDIARSQNAGTIMLNSAFDPEGSLMRRPTG
jgi:glycine cleavage system aminomethyltransferase T